MKNKKRGRKHPGSSDRPAMALAVPSERQTPENDRDGADARLLRLIAGHALFDGVPPGTLEPLLDRCEIRPLRVGEVLLAPGQINKHLYLLLEGQLKVRIDRIDSEQGFLIGPGEYTGEISVIDCRPAT
ncbi:cyclic nucleotide-binding domain-containing protein, partial [Arthrospira platensis SPKY1]|nr:cyclic nucleotide-binding domain-containing protein [Arthrospira platensis SPKY1]